MYEAVVREGVSGEGGYYLGMCHAVDDRKLLDCGSCSSLGAADIGCGCGYGVVIVSRSSCTGCSGSSGSSVGRGVMDITTTTEIDTHRSLQRQMIRQNKVVSSLALPYPQRGEDRLGIHLHTVNAHGPSWIMGHGSMGGVNG